ncbi:NAD(P)-binding protein [Mollisia scopiformis]|uniref:NAD(P)-binding protein n=1 Tax=Mollisia scopiformis TaxID=149040 RepID=A0A194XCI0_MOLSC|nr:NAD(P)-binding protein [Mollisia scopiformis]KUJ17869.1 NAD(P)-binding protein [Mollisia scopiformis]
MATSNYITKVAIVGAAGNSGKFMTEALLKTGKHTITAITRLDSESKFPDGVIVKKVDYEKPETLVEALIGNEALVITLSGFVRKESQMQLINAAGEAGVPWILPNEWSPDTANEALVKDAIPQPPSFHKSQTNIPAVTTRRATSDLAKSSYIAVSTGFWYEWSLAMAAAFGIDFANRAVTFFDEGETKISVSTWPQVGRAVAALLSLPVKSDETACLENFKNKVVYINSFTVNQREMLESALRVTGTKKEDWSVTKEPAKERYASGLEEIKEGKRIGFAKMMYTRVFFPDGCGDFENEKGTLNEVLGLPKEDIDEATKAAIEWSKSSNWVG